MKKGLLIKMGQRRAQSTVEFSAIIAILIGAFIAVGVYFKRGVQGRWKAATDDLGDQYDPRYTNTGVSHYLSSRTETVLEATERDGGFWTIRTDTTNTYEKKEGSITIGSPF